MTETMTAGEAWYTVGRSDAGRAVWAALPEANKASCERVAELTLSDAAAMRQRMGDGWRTIESAPRDRRSILVWCPERWNTYIVCWWDNGSNEPGWCHRGGVGGDLAEEPTHWQPLPAPPVSP